MLANRTLNEEQTLLRRQFIDFFESDRYEDKYARKLRRLMRVGGVRLIMDMADLLDYTPPTVVFPLPNGGATADARSLGHGVLAAPGIYIPLLELAVREVLLRLQPEYLKVDYRSRRVHVGFDGPVGLVLSPRQLLAGRLNTLVALEGVVARQSANRPRVLQTTHYCPATNKFTRREVRDGLTPLPDSAHLPTVNVMPKHDMEGNPLRTEFGLSDFMDSQCVVLQEAPERAPAGQLPRQVELRLDDDLVDAAKPGDRVLCVGVFVPYTDGGSAGGGGGKGFQTVVLVNHIVPAQHLALLARPVKAVEERLLAFQRRCEATHGPGGVLRALAGAVAPSIYGLRREKEAVLLQLVGGVERRAHSSHVRGDINVLLVGEPSTAKSQLLRYVLSVAPLALSTTGKGSSGVGLTAAVTADGYTGERTLSAGAMVLADRGVLCIDEFDKMNATDRVAMHEAMEQQTVTVAKAGIHASLNARCAVLAAANPIYGFYSVHHTLGFNVGLPESLLSRFDLTFIVLDQHSASHNRRIATHILRNHMTAAPADPGASSGSAGGASGSSGGSGGGAGAKAAGGGGGGESTTTVIHHRQMLPLGSRVAHVGAGDGTDGADSEHHASDSDGDDDDGAEGGSRRGDGGDADGSVGGLDLRPTVNSSGETIPSVDFLKSYVQLARRLSPLLTESSQRLISQHYVQLRDEQQQQQQQAAGGGGGGRGGFFVTARTLEAVVRLSTAHAKLRLSSVVSDADVEAAMTLLRASVNAAAAASSLRGDDNQHTREELRRADGQQQQQQQQRVGVVGASNGGGDNSTNSDGSEGAAAAAASSRKRTRAEAEAEGGGADGGAAASAAHTDDSLSTAGSDTSATKALKEAVMRVLRAAQSEQQTSVSLSEVLERLRAQGFLVVGATATSAATTTEGGGGGGAVATVPPHLPTMQEVRAVFGSLCAEHAESFMFESAQESGAEDDYVHFF